MRTTNDADDADMQGLAASMAFTRWASVFSRIGSSNFLHPRNLCNPWSIPSPFSGSFESKSKTKDERLWRGSNFNTGGRGGKRGEGGEAIIFFCGALPNPSRAIFLN